MFHPIPTLCVSIQEASSVLAAQVGVQGACAHVRVCACACAFALSVCGWS